MPDERTGAERIADERKRQMAELGWTPEHDDEHDVGDLALAAIAYAAQAANHHVLVSTADDLLSLLDPFPWTGDDDARKVRSTGMPAEEPQNETHRLRLLEKAGALIAAEIDRLVRLNAGLAKETK